MHSGRAKFQVTAGTTYHFKGQDSATCCPTLRQGGVGGTEPNPCSIPTMQPFLALFDRLQSTDCLIAPNVTDWSCLLLHIAVPQYSLLSASPPPCHTLSLSRTHTLITCLSDCTFVILSQQHYLRLPATEQMAKPEKVCTYDKK